ncbi:MAG: InlB B-repeat-containing protein [Lachnospiraceae bacterium]|nr:InlB B-repeat-containing protein [Lachnospiraceae bacterium]
MDRAGHRAGWRRLFYRIITVGCVCCFLWLSGIGTGAASLSEYTKYPGVSLSPDGRAFTTDAGVRSYEQYSVGYTVYTGEEAGSKPQTGEHYYTAVNVSEIRILKWEVAWAISLCIHPYYNMKGYHGLDCADTICGGRYPQGWVGYCADCGEMATYSLMYMNSGTAKGIRSIPCSADYYYLCPWCGGLEQGVSYSHNCERVSANGYYVSYNANAPAGSRVSGSMADTGHTYGNAELFEGEDAAKAGYGSTSLRKNAYVCLGYEFAGWNTKADGSGITYADGASVLNLTAVNGDTVTLYAQWNKLASQVNVDLAGGTLSGQGTLSASGRSGEQFEIASDQIVPPQGYRVTFVTNGGDGIAASRTKKSFSAWDTSGVVYGRMRGNIYYFGETPGVTDQITAVYEDTAFTLPDCQRSGYGFAGWYYDSAFSSFAGYAGAEIMVGEDTCLYARWLSLSLTSVENYQVLGGTGAVDLELREPDEIEKWYQIYQSTDGESWQPMFEELTRQEIHTGQAAADMAPPDRVTGFCMAVTQDAKMQLTWQEPADQGTVYYHQAESYRKTGDSYSLLCRSNVTQNLLVSGVKGYYYYQDGNSAGSVSGEETYTEAETALLEIGTEDTWLHIAAVDAAGNIGETVNVRIPAGDSGVENPDTDPDSGDDSGSDPDTDPDGDEEEAEIELTLYAWIDHSREGYEGDFKFGEGGVLHILAGGYAQRIEVAFPEEFTSVFPELNAIYSYGEPRLIQKEGMEFSVPLYTSPGVYEVTVTAYRDDREAEVYPVIVVVEESVLDELRTRIRNNL